MRERKANLEIFRSPFIDGEEVFPFVALCDLGDISQMK
jgi:hypothetical protein